MVELNNIRIYSYINSDNYSFLNNLKEKIKSDGYKVSLSKIILLAVIELKKNNSYIEIQRKLKENEMI